MVYEGKCNFGEDHIDQIGRNVTMRLDEHDDISKDSVAGTQI